MHRRTEITIESHRLLIVRRRPAAVRAWCEGCLAEVTMIAPSAAAAAAGVSSRTIYRWIEEARIHFREDFGGLLFVCAGSLSASDGRVEPPSGGRSERTAGLMRVNRRSK